MGGKKLKILIFPKVPKLFTHGMGCFGTGLGMLFHLYKGLLVTRELFEKIEKTAKRLLFSSPFSVRGPHKLKQHFFFAVFFFRFSQRVRIDEQTFIEVKQHPQAGPKKPISCLKSLRPYEKIKFLNFFFTISYAPHRLIIGINS